MRKVDVSEMRGPLSELMDQLSGENGFTRLHEFKLWLKRVEVASTPELKIWKTVKLGVHKTLAEYEEALKGKNFRIGEYASELLHHINISQQEIELDLGVLTISELGFKETVSIEKIYTRIIMLGGELCPPEIGLALRCQYEDQPFGEMNIIAMQGLANMQGESHIFGVAHVFGERWLRAYPGRVDRSCLGEYRVVFVIRRKQ